MKFISRWLKDMQGTSDVQMKIIYSELVKGMYEYLYVYHIILSIV